MRLPAKPPHIDLGLVPPERLGIIIRAIQEGPAPDGKYRHWDTLRRIPPPPGITIEEQWAAIKLARTSHYRMLPIVDRDGLPFRYALVDPVLQRLSRIDREAAGHIVMSEDATSREDSSRYIISSLVEEAITSSQLEGEFIGTGLISVAV